jgi:hypothetical protein
MSWNPWLFLGCWVGFQALQIGLAIVAICQNPKEGSLRPLISLMLSMVASALPVFTLLLFLRVFVIGGSPNVAQLAGESGYQLWRLWLYAWPALYFGNPPSLLLNIAVAALPPYPPRGWPSFSSRLCGIIASGLA